MRSTTPLPWGLSVDVHFHWILNRRAKSCTALQSNFRSLSLKMYYGGANTMIISYLTYFITPSELNKSALCRPSYRQFCHPFDRYNKYWFPPFILGDGLAKSMHRLWNNPMIGILPADSFLFPGFAFRQRSQLFTKLATSCRILGHQNRFLTNEYVELKSQCQNSSCAPFRILSCIPMCGRNLLQYLVRRSNFSP